MGPPFLLYLQQHIVHATTGRCHGQDIVLFLNGNLQEIRAFRIQHLAYGLVQVGTLHHRAAWYAIAG